MTESELDRNRYILVFEALLAGVSLEYKLGWKIYLNNGILYQSYQNKTHRSAILLNDFIKFIDDLPIDRLKRLFADTKLFRLQSKLIKENDIK